MNFGTFSQPKLPGVPGVESFKGQLFHTSRWDYDYVSSPPPPCPTHHISTPD